jgi:hypothetical protein
LQLNEPFGDKNTWIEGAELIGDVLILPSASFAAKQAGYVENLGWDQCSVPIIMQCSVPIIMQEVEG